MDANLQLGFQQVNTQIHAVRALLNGDNADNTALLTTAQGNLVAAINEVLGIANSSAGILENDFATMVATDKGLSKAAIAGYVLQEVTASRDSLIGGAPAAFDTFIELLTEIQANDGDISSAVADIAANTTLANAAQASANTAIANAATADAKAVTAQGDATTAIANAATADGKAVTAQTDLAAFQTAVGPLTTDYAAIVANGL